MALKIHCRPEALTGECIRSGFPFVTVHLYYCYWSQSFFKPSGTQNSFLIAFVLLFCHFFCPLGVMRINFAIIKLAIKEGISITLVYKETLFFQDYKALWLVKQL